jgi:anthranilate synthase/aminodeoxychorismate synthase-like glutamine amidotransferase
MIVIIDNYDSFVYNLAQYLGELEYEPVVYRNDKISLKEIEKLNPSHIVISPGPCTPLEAGISNDVVRYFGGKIPLLGVCLGHQCIGYVYGGRVVHSALPMHGKSSLIYHDNRTVYKNLSNPFPGGRYHSLVVKLEDNPGELEVTARTSEGVIMGIRHRQYTVEGFQFHPESILTEAGHAILSNFLKYRQGIWPEE